MGVFSKPCIADTHVGLQEGKEGDRPIAERLPLTYQCDAKYRLHICSTGHGVRLVKSISYSHK